MPDRKVRLTALPEKGTWLKKVPAQDWASSRLPATTPIIPVGAGIKPGLAE